MIKKLVNLKRDGILIPKIFGGVDTKNIIATGGGGSFSWTATQDCFVYDSNTWHNHNIYINGVQIGITGSTSSICVPAKKGDVITASVGSETSLNIVIFGIKYN